MPGGAKEYRREKQRVLCGDPSRSPSVALAEKEEPPVGRSRSDVTPITRAELNPLTCALSTLLQMFHRFGINLAWL